MTVPLSDVMEALDALAPAGLAESWDRPGLQVGDPSSPVDAVLVALDPSPNAVAQAVACRAQVLITHHPLLLEPLARLDLSSPLGGLVGELVRRGLALVACHTNLDRAEDGVNDRLARKLGLREVETLGTGEAQVKLAVTVPFGHEPAVWRALEASGAGRIGRYGGCSFSARGTGRFRPLEGAEPFLGDLGQIEEVEETRIEAVVPESRRDSARRAVVDAHPYEEPAIDIFPLDNRSRLGGIGRVGVLPDPQTLRSLAADVGRILRAPGVRYVGAPDREVRRVAVCGGSGSGLWIEARRAGAEVLVTGDVKYHVARDAQAQGFALVDAGHGVTETGAVEALADGLKDWAGRSGGTLRVESWVEPEPFGWLLI